LASEIAGGLSLPFYNWQTVPFGKVCPPATSVAGARWPRRGGVFREDTSSLSRWTGQMSIGTTLLFGWMQRQETLDLSYLTLLCDNLKNRMFLQNFFSWPYFGNLLYCSSYPHQSTIPQPNNFIRDCRIRLLGQKRMFTAETSVFDLEVLFYSP
jgi:hypothetical protein